jgi:hypothetical protein
LQHVDRRLIRKPRDATALGFVFGNFVNVRAEGHELHRKGSSDHGLARMQYLKSVGVLIVEAPLLKHSPNFLGGKFPRPFQQVVRHLGSSVGKAIKWLLRRVVDQILFGEAQ